MTSKNSGASSTADMDIPKTTVADALAGFIGMFLARSRLPL
ncbi:MAG: hypothetical protein QY306_10865 [Anaerolineales bacterium]|nr:MAG: hypothetical protein QY306_10865 [Anaerolineales bacterium]